MENSGDGRKKINNNEKSFLYSIAFSLTINQYLYPKFKNLFFD